jgi:hypothetical protein
MSYDKNEQRRHERFDFPSTIEYILEPRESDEVRKGVSINMSLTGLSAYVFESLPIGQKLFIEAGIPGTHRPATICWSKEKEVDFYISGLKFN